MKKTYFFGSQQPVEDLSKSNPEYRCIMEPPEPAAVFMVVDGEEFTVFYDGGREAVFGDRESAILFVSAYQDVLGRPVRLLENFSA
jgi:hypothetical protein